MSGLYNYKKINKYVKSIEKATIKGEMYSIRGAFPAVIEGSNVIYGELLNIHKDGLIIIDSIEYPAGYRRVVKEVNKQNNKRILAWCYLYLRNVEYFNKIKSGNWRKYLERRK